MQIVRIEEWQCGSVEVVHHEIATGLSDTAEWSVSAVMSLKGVLFDTRYGRPTPNTRVDVEIEFTEEQRYDEDGYEAGDEDLPDGIPEGYDLGANYIGHVTILLPAERRTDLTVSMKLFLPLHVFPLLMAMRGTRIKLSTVHDSLAIPRVHFDTQYIAAYVRRVTFKPLDDR